MIGGVQVYVFTGTKNHAFGFLCVEIKHGRFNRMYICRVSEITTRCGGL